MNPAKELPRILVVDDEPIILETFQAIFERHFQVVTAGSGKEALEKIAANSIRMVLLDINMPDMNGIEIIRRIRVNDEGLPIIVVSAMKDKDTADELRRFGVSDYIAKPFDVEEIITLVSKRVAQG